MSSILSLESVTKKFGGFTAVDRFSADIERGSIVGLIGPNGAGKTTLFNMIACTFPPTSGQILYKGQIITGHKAPAVARLGLARTFQITKPFGDMNVIDNIMVGSFLHHRSKAVARQAAMEIFETLNMHGHPYQSAHSLTTVDRKKLEVARALATKPDLLLLDEVMAGCNPQEKLELSAVIRNISDSGVTVIIIEHDIKTIMSICETIYMLHRGKLIVSGTPEEVSCNALAIRAYLGEEYKHAAS